MVVCNSLIFIAEQSSIPWTHYNLCIYSTINEYMGYFQLQLLCTLLLETCFYLCLVANGCVFPLSITKNGTGRSSGMPVFKHSRYCLSVLQSALGPYVPHNSVQESYSFRLLPRPDILFPLNLVILIDRYCYLIFNLHFLDYQDHFNFSSLYW